MWWLLTNLPHINLPPTRHTLEVPACIHEVASVRWQMDPHTRMIAPHLVPIFVSFMPPPGDRVLYIDTQQLGSEPTVQCPVFRIRALGSVPMAVKARSVTWLCMYSEQSFACVGSSRCRVEVVRLQLVLAIWSSSRGPLLPGAGSLPS